VTPPQRALRMGEMHERIEELEAEIEDLADLAARCRRMMTLAKTIMALGGVTLVAAVVDPGRLGPITLIGAIAAVLGGIVVFGSNRSTLQRANADLKAAETVRAELIDRTARRVVSAT